MLLRRYWALALVPMLTAFLAGAGCIFSPDEEPTPQPTPEELKPRTTPDNVIADLEIIYNDKVRSATERRELYQSLLPPDGVPPGNAFLFHFQPADIIAHQLPESWPKDEEIAAHDRIFHAQDNGQIYSLELRVTRNPAADLNPPQVGREGWKEIFATNVYLRLMFNVDDGLEVNGGQAEFLFAPPDTTTGLFVINDWTDLPHPGG
jgi:hypothetical protein